MTGEILLTCIVPAAYRDVMRAVLSCFDGPDYFTSPLSADGLEPATHYISSGLVNPLYLASFLDPAHTFARCLEENPAFAYTQQEVTDAIAASHLSNGQKEVEIDGAPVVVPESVWEMLEALGLKQVNGGTL